MWAATVRRTLRKTRLSFLNQFVRNDKRRWDQSYAEGQWAMLDSLQQRARHYVIAGMLKARGCAAASVLDVGCGTGALAPHLPANVSRYVGIDISAEAIRICRERHDSRGDRAFVPTAFEEYAPQETFDVVVFNEMLYYYPLSQIPRVLSRASGLFPRAGGAIIVSIHNRSLKRRSVWKRLHAYLGCGESVEVMDVDSKTSWRVSRYDIDRSPRCLVDA